MSYKTPADIVEQEQDRRRAALRWVVPAFGLGVLGVLLGFLGHRVNSRPVSMVGLGIGAAGVFVGCVAVVRTGLVIIAGMLRRR